VNFTTAAAIIALIAVCAALLGSMLVALTPAVDAITALFNNLR